jgi:hypothetical protein
MEDRTTRDIPSMIYGRLIWTICFSFKLSLFTAILGIMLSLGVEVLLVFMIRRGKLIISSVIGNWTIFIRKLKKKEFISSKKS